MGWGKKSWPWWLLCVTMINPRWRLLMHSLHYIDVTCWSQCGCSEEIHQHSIHPSRVLPFPLSRCEQTLHGFFLCPIPTGWAMYMQIAPLVWHWGSLASGRGRDGVESVFPYLRGTYGKAQKRSTTSLTRFHRQSLCWPLITIRKRVPSWRDQALKLLQNVNQARAQLECELVQ